MTLQSFAHPAAWSADYRIAAAGMGGGPVGTPPSTKPSEVFPSLVALAETVAELKCAGWHTLARFVREEVCTLIDTWLDGRLLCGDVEMALRDLLAQAQDGVAASELQRAEQLAAARAHAATTALAIDPACGF